MKYMNIGKRKDSNERKVIQKNEKYVRVDNIH